MGRLPGIAYRKRLGAAAIDPLYGVPVNQTVQSCYCRCAGSPCGAPANTAAIHRLAGSHPHTRPITGRICRARKQALTHTFMHTVFANANIAPVAKGATPSINPMRRIDLSSMGKGARYCIFVLSTQILRQKQKHSVKQVCKLCCMHSVLEVPLAPGKRYMRQRTGKAVCA